MDKSQKKKGKLIEIKLKWTRGNLNKMYLRRDDPFESRFRIEECSFIAQSTHELPMDPSVRPLNDSQLPL